MVETYNRKSKWLELKPYCHHAKDDSFMEVVEWSNGEGFDVIIESRGKEQISMTWGQWEALNVLVNYRESLGE